MKLCTLCHLYGLWKAKQLIRSTFSLTYVVLVHRTFWPMQVYKSSSHCVTISIPEAKQLQVRALLFDFIVFYPTPLTSSFILYVKISFRIFSSTPLFLKAYLCNNFFLVSNILLIFVFERIFFTCFAIPKLLNFSIIKFKHLIFSAKFHVLNYKCI